MQNRLPILSLRLQSVYIQIALVLSFIPIIQMVLLMTQEAFRIPFIDSWYADIYVMQRFLEGTLTVGDLFASHNGHVIVLQRIIVLLSMLFAQYREPVLLVFYFACTLLSWFLLTAAFVKVAAHQRAILIAVPLAAMLFAPSQYDNYVTAFQGVFLLAQLGYALVVWACLTQRGNRRVILVILGVLLAVWSQFSGNALWLAAPLGLWAVGERRLRVFALFTLIAAANLVVYAQSFFSGPARMGEDLIRRLTEDAAILRLTAVFLGAPARVDMLWIQQAHDDGFIMTRLAFVLGVSALAALFGLSLVARRTPGVWLVPILYSLGSAVSLAMTNVQAMDNIFWSKYTTVAIPFWVGMVGFVATLVLNCSKPIRTVASGVVAAVTALFWLQMPSSFDIPHNARFSEQCVIAYEVRPVECDRPFTLSIRTDEPAVQEEIRERIVFLREHRLSLFADPVTLDLTTLPAQNISERIVNVESRRFGWTQSPIVFAHALGQYQQQVYVYDGYRVTLEGSIYVEANNPVSEREDGVTFQIAAIEENGTATGIFEMTYDPHQNSQPIPFAVNLEEYAGQVIRLHFSTLPRETNDRDWSIWIAPRIRYS